MLMIKQGSFKNTQPFTFALSILGLKTASTGVILLSKVLCGSHSAKGNKRKQMKSKHHQIQEVLNLKDHLHLLSDRNPL